VRKRRRADIDGDFGEGGPDIWQRLSRFLLALVFLLVMAAILSLFWPEIERQRRLDADLDELIAVRDHTLEQRDNLAAKLEWMRTDPEYLEVIARDRLDLHKKGEYVIRIEDARVHRSAAPILSPAEAPEEIRKPMVIE